VPLRRFCPQALNARQIAGEATFEHGHAFPAKQLILSDKLGHPPKPISKNILYFA
jgi:hypothetical protein